MLLQEFTNFTINRIITHEIFKRNSEREIVDPIISTLLTELSNDGKQELATRIVEAVGQDSKSVEMEIDQNDDGSVVHSVQQIMEQSSNESFIEMSKVITMKLVHAQTTRSLPGGIVVLIDGTTGVGSNKFVAVIKAELQGGFQKSTNNTIEFVKDLLLTPQQKLYKIGIFLDSTQNNLRSFVYDHNMSKSLESGMAAYFYDAFLGCKVAHTDKYYTNRFYHETKEFIDDASRFTDDEKFDLHTHLYSYLKSDLSTISLTDFADQYISDTDKRDAYITHMQDSVDTDGFTRSITKDLSDIKSKLRIRKLTFSNKVKISAPSDSFDENIRVLGETEDQNGNFKTTLEIAGKISDFDK